MESEPGLTDLRTCCGQVGLYFNEDERFGVNYRVAAVPLRHTSQSLTLRCLRHPGGRSRVTRE